MNRYFLSCFVCVKVKDDIPNNKQDDINFKRQVVPVEYSKQILETNRKNISKNLKIQSWNLVYGMSCGEAICHACNKNKIYQGTCECCRIIPVDKGGFTEVNNLIPVCKECKKKAGKMNFYTFLLAYYPTNLEINKIIDKIRKN